jgi:predicted thioesterase
MKELQSGLVFEIESKVTQEESAKVLGSGSLDVFGTPAMALLVEQACMQMVEAYLPAGHTSVGVELQIKHLAPTPLGDLVRVRAEVVELTDRLIQYKAKIWDSTELIGEANHKRAIIDVDRFLSRVTKKFSDLADSSTSLE